MTYRREYYADPCPALTAARARAERPAAPAPAPHLNLDVMLDGALIAERAAAERVREAERTLAVAQEQARAAAEAVRTLRERIAARDEASLDF